uniref:Disease resistance RPP13-like protein 1 n=1 Tax=Fagus sylvatica TaxID=28930 RepID=A0A2N9HVW9_FAGSY
MAVGEAFLSAFLQVLFDRLASRDFIDLLRYRKFDDLLEKLKITLLTVTALLNDAEEKQFHSPAVEKWLHMAKDALYDAEDILDELATETLRCKLEADSKAGPNQVWNWNLISTPCNTPSSRGIESKLKKVIDKLELIANYKDVLGLKDNVGGYSSGLKQRLPTTSLVDETCVYGRGHDKDLIIEMLLRDAPSNKIGVVPIVGMAGIGKTTLAQIVYNDDRVKNHFHLIIWVCVSDQFDVVEVTKTILRSVTLKHTDLNDLNLLQVCLKENLVGKRFLLVLDDVWNKRNNDCDLLWSPLKTGAKGSKILVTTRNRDVASSMGTVPAHHLKCLSFEDCWLLFKSQAFENRNIDVYPNLEAIGSKVVEKCEGLPLAAKRLGILLRSRQEEDEWKDILNRKIWDLPDDESDILQSLRLSYHHLPAHLKQCFAYCSIFPMEYEFDKETLVLLWMAEGFVQQPKGKKRLEEVGGEYFLELVSRLGDKLKDGNQNRIFEKARHSSYIRGRRDVLSKFEAFYGVECLRTFLPLDPTGMIGVSYLANEVPRDLFPKLRYLRVLSFNACRITQLPDSIGLENVVSFTDAMEANLKDKQELNQLVLQWSNVFEDSIDVVNEKEESKMQQILTINKDISIRGYRHKRFPSIREALKAYEQEPAELTLGRRNSSDDARNETDVLEMLQPHKNMEQILIKDYGGTKFPSWIGSPLFSNLIRLRLSNCRNCSYLPPLGQLPSLKDLTIEGMEGIKRIAIEFCGDGCSSALPFPSLETLKFDNMLQWEEWSSSGIGGRGDFNNLQNIEIRNCPKLRKLPHDFPSLKRMSIKGCEELETLRRVLTFDDCFEQGREFPCLLELSIWACPNLRELPHLFPSLGTLEIDRCQKLEELPRLSFNPALEELRITHLGELTTFSNEIAFQNLQCLQRLEISGCPFLKELPQRLYKLSSLKELRLSKCPLLVSFPETGLPSTLIGLEIIDCEALQFLPGWKMHNNVKASLLLEYLVIEGCSSLTSLPRGQLPSTLKQLEIHNCMNLEFIPEQMIHNNSCLEFFKISCCKSVTSISEDTFGLSTVTPNTVMNLKELIINNCTNLKSLPGGLHNHVYLDYLEIVECPLLQSFPEPGLPTLLRSIRISNCRSLKSLPNWMYRLTSLKELHIDGCSSLLSFPEGGLPSNLLSLSILDCENLKPSYEWGLHRLTCLVNFSFGGCQGLVSFPEKWFLPTSLSSLCLQRLPNLESLPKGLKNLTSLDNLDIWECDRLQSLSVSSNTSEFGILGCPLTFI